MLYQAMMLHPHIQAKAQEEIDRVVGSDRMPSWEDWDDLPYIRAVMKETLRCQSIPDCNSMLKIRLTLV